MKRIVALGVCGVIAVEAIAFAVPAGALWAPVWSGAVVTVTLLAVLRGLTRQEASAPVRSDADDRAELLWRWVSRTQTVINRADSTRREWDRHLRPVLARQFEMATGHRQSKDPAAFRAAGHMVLGRQLWPWVDPDNIARTDDGEPGPGRGALDEILKKIQRL